MMMILLIDDDDDDDDTFLQDEIELRRLRTENRLLRQRIDLLENESSELADKLIQVNVMIMTKKTMTMTMILMTMKTWNRFA